jgi:hypothetical protein
MRLIRVGVAEERGEFGVEFLDDGAGGVGFDGVAEVGEVAADAFGVEAFGGDGGFGGGAAGAVKFADAGAGRG